MREWLEIPLAAVVVFVSGYVLAVLALALARSFVRNVGLSLRGPDARATPPQLDANATREAA